MTDYYLKAATEADMDDVLLVAGLVVEYEDEDGFVSLVPTEGVSLDVIGPIVKWDYSVDPPVEIDYPEWHVNVRVVYELTEEQTATLEPVVIVPPNQPYRVFA